MIFAFFRPVPVAWVVSSIPVSFPAPCMPIRQVGVAILRRNGDVNRLPAGVGALYNRATNRMKLEIKKITRSLLSPLRLGSSEIPTPFASVLNQASCDVNYPCP